MALRPDWCEMLRTHRERPQPQGVGHIYWENLEDENDIIPVFPPATAEQLYLTEEHLGFALPSTLRQMYVEVANGGEIFRGYSGPIMLGLIGGYPTDPEPSGPKTIDQAVSRSGWRLTERVDRALQRYPGVYVTCEEAPDRFVTIAEWDCGVGIALDGWTGRLYEVCDDMESVDSYRASLGLPIEPETEYLAMQIVQFFASSVDDMIEGLLTGRPNLFFGHCRIGLDVRGPLTQEILRNSDQ